MFGETQFPKRTAKIGSWKKKEDGRGGRLGRRRRGRDLHAAALP